VNKQVSILSQFIQEIWKFILRQICSKQFNLSDIRTGLFNMSFIYLSLLENKV
jgi:hypothetical protein